MASNNMMAEIGREKQLACLISLPWQIDLNTTAHSFPPDCLFMKGKIHGVPLNFHSSVNSSLYENGSFSQTVIELVNSLRLFIVYFVCFICILNKVKLQGALYSYLKQRALILVA